MRFSYRSTPAGSLPSTRRPRRDPTPSPRTFAPHSLTRLAVAILALLSTVGSVRPASASADTDSSFRSYRVPESRQFRWTASGRGSAVRASNSQASGSRSLSGNWLGALRTTVSQRHETDARLFAWSASLDLSHRRFHEQGAAPSVLLELEREASSRRSDQIMMVSAGGRWYIVDSDWGASWSLVQFATALQAFDDQLQHTRPLPGSGSTQTTMSQTTRSSGRLSYDGQATVGLGYGRVRDATAVYQVEVAEARLLETGALLRPLGPGTRRRLANLFALGPQFQTAHERPGKYFWREFERLLREDGGLAAEGLDTWALQRLLEPISIRVQSALRLTGASIGPVVSLAMRQDRLSDRLRSHTRVEDGGLPVSESEFSLDRGTNTRSDFISVGAAVEWHRPVGPRWQWDVSHSTVIDESGESATGLSAAQVGWVVSARWFADGGVPHAVLWRGHGSGRHPENWQLRFHAGLDWFVEDAWALQLTGELIQDGSPLASVHDASIQLGVTHVFTGLFSAPGDGIALNARSPGP